jgi:hypothetical protein
VLHSTLPAAVAARVRLSVEHDGSEEGPPPPPSPGGAYGLVIAEPFFANFQSGLPWRALVHLW